MKEEVRFSHIPVTNATLNATPSSTFTPIKILEQSGNKAQHNFKQRARAFEDYLKEVAQSIMGGILKDHDDTGDIKNKGNRK